MSNNKTNDKADISLNRAIKALLDAGADITNDYVDTRTPAEVEADEKQKIDLVKRIVADNPHLFGSSNEQTNKQGETNE